MHAVSRALPLALGLLFAVFALRAQPVALPPIFAPRPPPSSTEARVKPATPTVAAPVSDRVRSLINAATTRVLEDAVVFDAPLSAGGTYLDTTTGATVMAPVVVREMPLTDSQVRPPSLRLFHFVPFGGDKHRRLAGGATMPLFETLIGKKELTIELSILNAAGNGIDHNIDFTRAELAFRFKW